MSKTIIVNGCDSRFFEMMQESLDSLERLNLRQKADMGILDLGISENQIQYLLKRGYIVKKPRWTMNIPDSIRKPHQLGLVARTDLREYYPGYDIYLWFDADAWSQTPEFFHELTQGALKHGAAIIREIGSGYRKDFIYAKWWYGNMVASYGVVKGRKVALLPVANIGIMALSSNAPHWEVWKKYYQKFIDKRGKVNNQHSFNAALVLEKLDYYCAPARCNWITVLSDPFWNPKTKMLCEPNQGAAPLSVIHLAGPGKSKKYNLKQTNGGFYRTKLTYHEIVKKRFKNS